MLVAALVVVVGALVGVAGFAYDQGHADWRPHLTRTSAGLRVTQPVGDINDPALAGDHLVWQDGSYTIVLDVSSGTSRLIGAARDGQSVVPPIVSLGAASWQESSGDASQRTLLYGYDFSSHRRRLLLSTAAFLDPPAIAGPTLYWLRGQGSATAVVACDIDSGRRRVLATGHGLGPFLMADGSLVAWSHQVASGAPFTLTVDDLTLGTTTDLELPAQTPGAVFDTPILADGTLAWWRWSKDGPATITTYDLKTLAERQIASGRSLVGPGFDGATVVWAQPAAAGGDDVMGLRLASGGAFRIAHVAAGVQSVMVSGDRVAWWVRTASHAWIDITRLPR
ncbi:MAG TPA: hypothetical protein VL117_09735 [Thermoleophilia bacterium]|nr:hypothetical protein [Thermoleophilia bacterium]